MSVHFKFMHHSCCSWSRKWSKITTITTKSQNVKITTGTRQSQKHGLSLITLHILLIGYSKIWRVPHYVNCNSCSVVPVLRGEKLCPLNKITTATLYNFLLFLLISLHSYLKYMFFLLLMLATWQLHRFHGSIYHMKLENLQNVMSKSPPQHCWLPVVPQVFPSWYGNSYIRHLLFL